MEHLGGNPHIKFLLGGNWDVKVIKMSVRTHRILNYVAKKRKAT